ncbi:MULTISPECIES: acetyltransferase [Pseudomonas]|jgi:putative colanic acid biosynthesis acetyltransferase WcaF|uniref:Colanic acid biosynthesis acetyltransferase n=3 Tax=Pseudomonas fluorescens group TaxID=136843 RepID=A0A5M9IES6_PSEMA|nr:MULTISPECIES: acetyltransferase [Pseudomonas]HAA40772.1 putative colanic acid biosynthesis acetyltransferase [Pseudomonas sp.]KAA8554473.1 Galactoside O-acetyltransferase [Pseudomonas marginalis]MCP1463818.1 putative colanic acid biosynthesis acetyltransferase WcaF [Pseudomonas sp. S3E17]NMZ93702.1 putative colanic acid biosynthesis acetyltransferase [Pseudomonas marginalis]OCW18817.1 acetyltransferase [Pseudomonas sp. S3E12]
MSDFAQLKYVDTLPRSNKARRLLWGIVYQLLFRPTPRWMLHNWRRWLLRCFGAKVGVGCRIAPTCSIWAPWNLEIGDYTAIGDGVDVYAMAKITLGSKVTISQRSFLCTGSHDTRSLLRPLVTREIVIKDHVWVAAEAFIHPGCVLEEGCVVGARSVVTASQPAWMICVGAPCRPLKTRDIAL